MKTLRQQMDDAMVLRGFALRTRESYLAAVKGLAKHYHRAPDLLSAQEVQDYLLHLIVERKLAYASVNRVASACRFLFDRVLRQPQSRFDIPMAKVPKTLPRILSRDEVARVFAAASNLRARTLLRVTYAAGLRVSEVCALQSADIESAPDRMCIKVRQGKGDRDRYTMLSPALLETLRDYWRLCRPRTWLFPNPSGIGPIDAKAAQRMYCAARDKAGLGRAGGIHTLRHCFATHLLESGVDIHLMKLLAIPLRRQKTATKWLVMRYGFRTRRDDARPYSPNSVSMHRLGRYSCADLHVEIMRGYPFQHCRLPLSHDSRLDFP